MHTKNATDKIELVLIDTYKLFRESIRQVLGSHPRIDVVAEGSTIKDALKLTKESSPHILLIDIKIIAPDGLFTIKQISKQSPETKVIILSEQDDDIFMIEALNVGAKGYFMKEMNSDMFISAIKDVNSGLYWYHPHVTNQIIRDYFHVIQEIFGKNPQNESQSQHPLAIFTPREYEVLQLLGKGYSNKVIAEKLNITNFTVNSHVRNILKKSHVNDRTHAVVNAVEKGWVTISRK